MSSSNKTRFRLPHDGLFQNQNKLTCNRFSTDSPDKTNYIPGSSPRVQRRALRTFVSARCFRPASRGLDHSAFLRSLQTLPIPSRELASDGKPENCRTAHPCVSRTCRTAHPVDRDARGRMDLPASLLDTALRLRERGQRSGRGLLQSSRRGSPLPFHTGTGTGPAAAVSSFSYELRRPVRLSVDRGHPLLSTVPIRRGLASDFGSNEHGIRHLLHGCSSSTGRLLCGGRSL